MTNTEAVKVTPYPFTHPVLENCALEIATVEFHPENKETSAYERHSLAITQALSQLHSDESMDLERMKGIPIPMNEFLGKTYSMEEKKLVRVGTTTGTNTISYSPNEVRGLGFIMTNHPYSTLTRASDADYETTTASMHQLCDELFGGLSSEEDLEVYDWAHPTTQQDSKLWSSYFEAGLEWWGAYAYSIYNKKTGQMVCMFASTSD